MRLRLVLAILAGLVTVLAGAPVQAASRPAFRALTFNACGNVCRLGEVDLTTKNLAYQIRAKNVAVAMVQELCFSQFLVLRSRLARYGYTGVFGTAATGGRCDADLRGHGKGFGVAILARGALSGQVVYRLPSPYGVGEEGRVVLGASARLAGRNVFVATTHTAPRGPNLGVQLTMLRRWLVPISAGRPVLFGGDLNALPDNAALDGFYAAFREADDDRDNPMPTFVGVPRKIDYLFGSKHFLAPRGMATACTIYSDHCLYLGAFA